MHVSLLHVDSRAWDDGWEDKTEVKNVAEFLAYLNSRMDISRVTYALE